MTYRFVAAPDHWSRSGVPIRAIVIHMAEGGGTVSWLTRDDGNSSHYVVEYDGDIVQMVREDRAAGSINPNLLRTNDDPAFIYLGQSIVYGKSARTRALGTYDKNPNAAVIAIEVEGFARNGPNAAQRASLKRLVADIRSRHGKLPTLGHRDFQSYKACPGKLIPWVDYGGHGRAVSVALPPTDTESEATMESFALTVADYDAVIPTGTKLFDNSDLVENTGTITVSPGRKMPYIGLLSGVRIVEYIGADLKSRHKAMFVRSNAVSLVARPKPPVAGPVDCAAEVTAAIAADRLKAKVTWG